MGAERTRVEAFERSITVRFVDEREAERKYLDKENIVLFYDEERLLAIAADDVARRIEELRRHEEHHDDLPTDRCACSFCRTEPVVARFAGGWSLCGTCRDIALQHIEDWVEENADQVLGTAL